MCAKFKSINSSALSRKKYDKDNFTPSPFKRLWGQNTSVEIWLIVKLIEKCKLTTKI